MTPSGLATYSLSRSGERGTVGAIPPASTGNTNSESTAASVGSRGGSASTVRRTTPLNKRVALSADLESAIEELLGDAERLAEIGRLGARLVLHRAVEKRQAGEGRRR